MMMASRMESLKELLDPFQPLGLSQEQQGERAAEISELAVRLNKAMFDEVFPALGSTHDSGQTTQAVMLAAMQMLIYVRDRLPPHLQQRYVGMLPASFASILELSIRLHGDQRERK